MTDADVIRELIRLARREGSQRKLAAKMGFAHHGVLSDVIRGDKRPGPTILEYLGLQRKEVIVKEKRS